MNKLMDRINMLKDRVSHILHPDASANDAIAEEQTEQEEQVDVVVNPLQGVDVIRHPVGRHPRRA